MVPRAGANKGLIGIITCFRIFISEVYTIAFVPYNFTLTIFVVGYSIIFCYSCLGYIF